MMYFIIKYVSIGHNCKNCTYIGMDQSLHINFDDAPLAHRGLNGKEMRSPVAW